MKRLADMKTTKGAKRTMYPMHKDNEATIGEEGTPDDCFAEKARNWLWLLVVGVVAVTIYAVAAFSGRNAVGSSTGGTSPQYDQVRNVAFGPQNAYRGRTPIRELDLEVNASALEPGVVIHTIYGGGRAERAGLRPGDTICRFNGRRVTSVRQFQALVARADPRSSIRMQIIRNRRRLNTTVLIGDANTPGTGGPAGRMF